MTSPRKFDAVLFDFGGVFTGSPFAAVEAVGQELGIAPGRLMEIVFGPYDTDGDHPWHRLERAEISFAEARQAIADLAAREGLAIEPLQILIRTSTDPSTRGLLVDRVRRLRAEGYRTGLVTNNVAEFRESWRSLFPIAELFEFVIDSSEVGMRKPNVEIYRLALAALGNIAPSRVVFLDDYPNNIEVARSLGMEGVLVTPDTAETVRNLDRVLG